MAVKTFAVGELVTASDANTYFANSGLVYVKSQTVGTGVSSVTVSSAFSAEYDNYRIVYGGGTGSTDITLSLKMGASTTAYYAVVNYASYSALATPVSTGDSNQALWRYIGYAGTNYTQVSLDLINPNKAQWTTYNASSWAATTVAGTSSGIHQVATAYTDFTLGVNTGTISGGTITVYGYRKA